MIMGRFLSVVIDIINVRHAIIKTENHPPVCPNGHGPKAFHLAFERMQPQPRLVQVSKGRGGMKGRQNIPKRLGMFTIDPALGRPVSKRRFSPLWRIVHIIPHRNLTRGACQEQF